MTEIVDPFRRISSESVTNLGLSREDRVRLLGEFARAVLTGHEPSRAALLFVAGGIGSWLQQGGSLTREYWRTCGPQGCTVTEAILWHRLQCDERSSRRAQSFLALQTIEKPQHES